MERKVSLGLALGLLSAQLSWGQLPPTGRTVQYNGRLEYDSYFGLYPTLSVNWAVDSLRELTAYATYYTNPDFFGLETGLEAEFTSAHRNWTLTPTVGLLSGSVFVVGRSFTPAEGFVGALAVKHENSWGFVQVFGSYYGAWKRLTADTYDFLFSSLQIGRAITPRCRLSVVYEQMANVRLARNRSDVSEFSVPRLGLATELHGPRGLTIQAIGGWTRYENQRLFFRFGISQSFSGRSRN